MKSILTLGFLLSAALAAYAGDGDCWSQGKAKPWQGYNKVVKWEGSLADAQARARKEKKLILYYVLVGDLDKEGCWAAGDVLRTVTFSDPKVGEALAKEFVCAWKNRKDGFHNCDPKAEEGIFKGSADAFPTRNIITMFLTPDLQVVHYFSGYFSPALFVKQVDFARAARDAVFDKSFKIKKGARDAFVRLHDGAYAALKKEAEALAKRTESWKDATADLGTYEYDGQKHEHAEACLWVMNSVDSYVSLVHGDLAGKKEIQEQVQQFNLRRKCCEEKCGFQSLMREARDVKKEPGERKIVDGLPGLSEVEGKYLYGNPFTEE